jgi:hypothetical protein
LISAAPAAAMLNVDLKNMTVIRLRKGGNVKFVEEVDCAETMFMAPYHDDVTFGLNASFIDARHDPTCKWTFAV